MTDRHAGYLITLDRSIREDDAQQLIAALRMFSFVVNVTPVVDNLDIQIAKERADSEWRDRLLAIVRESLAR